MDYESHSRSIRETLLGHLDALDQIRKQTTGAPATLSEFIGDLCCGELMANVPPDARFDAGLAVGFLDATSESLGITPTALLRRLEELSNEVKAPSAADLPKASPQEEHERGR